MILCIETATNVCSVAICDKGKLIDLRESRVDKSHASLLTVFIEELLEKNNLRVADLDAVAVSKGPGSYTGLRIGVSTAKGICYGADIPLLGINTLKSMYYGAKEKYAGHPGIKNNTLICPMIDARRMEVYSSIFDLKGGEIQAVKAELINKESYADYLEKSSLIFFGNGAEKCKELITSPNALFIDGYELSAASMAIPAHQALQNKAFEDIAYFEPYYLKDFVATIPRKNILGK